MTNNEQRMKGEDIDTKIRATLTYIKANPGSSTNKVSAEVRVKYLNGNLLDDLYDKGLVKGTRVLSCDSFGADYLDLLITPDGEKHLQSLFAGAVKQTLWRRPKTLLKFVLGAVVAILTGLAIKGFSHLFGW